MDMITLWLFFAFTVERVVELILSLVPRIDKKQVLGVDVPILLSFTFALILAFGAKLDFFQIVEIEFAWPAVGSVFSAIFMVGGSTVLHDLLGWINAVKNNSRNGY